MPAAPVGDPLIVLANEVFGQPGDSITVTDTMSNATGTCELLDRTIVQVLLLPS